VLETLATLTGVEPSYRNIAGRRVVASDDALEGVLGVLGVDTGTVASMQDTIDREGAARASRLLDPAYVVVHRRRPRIVTRPLRDRRGGVLQIHTEGGEHWTIPLPGRSEGDGGDQRCTTDLTPFDLPIGYHTVRVEDGTRTEEAPLLVRPGRASRPRRAFGVFAPLYGLRSASDWGIGSTTELARLGRWAATEGAAFVGTLPLYPAFYGTGADVSPYRPVSRLAWNEIYLDVTSLPELAASPEAREHVGSRRTRRLAGELRGTTGVEYERTYAAKRAVIEACAQVVATGPRGTAFGRFVAEHPEIRAYARFRATREATAPEHRRQRESFYEYGQFAMDEAMRDAVRDGGLPLYLDLPVGVHPDGFDPAHFRGVFCPDGSIGAPPDDFYVSGQSWGIPPLHPIGVRSDGYAYVIATYRHLFRHASVVRIDHVMGFERCFVVPDGCDARDGAYVRYPSAELRAVAAIEADRAGTTLVGEDLGTVPPATRSAMGRDGMLRSAVFAMDATADRPAPPTDSGSMASFGTHDLPRFAAFIQGLDVAERVASGALATGDAAAVRAERAALRAALTATGSGERGAARAFRAVLAWLAETEADLAVVDVGDLLLDPEQENRPGPLSGEQSWRHRLPAAIEEIEADRRCAGRIAIVAAGRPGEAVA
jgi:4-alpha-glucanotransferase